MQLLAKTTGFKISGWKRPSLSPILSLFSTSSPTAIIRLVVTIIIYPLQCMIKRSWSHIRTKFFERLQPANTNFNTTLSVPMVRPMFWIYAAIFHICPNMIFRLVGQIRTRTFSLATTRPHGAALQIATFDHYNISAVATALESYPTSSTDNIRGTFNYNELSKSLSNSIYKFHKRNYNNIPTICQEVIV